MNNILHLINDASPSRGGAQKILALLLSVSNGAGVFSQSREDGKAESSHNLIGGRFWRASLLFDLMRSRPAVVIVHSRCYMPFAIIFRLLGIRSVFYCHAHYRSQSFLLKLFKFNRYMAVSDSVKGYLVDAGVSANSIIVNHNPLLKPISLATGFTSTIQSDQLFCVGGLQPWKGFKELLQLLQLDNGIKLKLVGDGPLRSELEQLSAKQSAVAVKLVGYSDDPYSLVVDSPIQIIPSLEEGFGLVAIEAINQGKIIIYSKLPALDEVLQDDEYAFSFSHADPESFRMALASAKALLVSGLDERQLLARSEAIAEKYTISIFRASFKSALNSL